MAKEKLDLTERITQSMQAAKDEIGDPWAEQLILKAQAKAAQLETAALVRNIAQSLSDICVRSNHRGAVKATENSPSMPCLRCKTKVKHYREIADFIAP